MTESTSLADLGTALLETAHTSNSGRAAQSLHGGSGRSLRQTVLAFVGGHALGEHDSPGEATLQVLSGRVRLGAGDDGWELAAGELIAIPPARHSLAALEDSVVLLTVVA
jgi:quercetin dioxygenase-like cupin family protein